MDQESAQRRQRHVNQVAVSLQIGEEPLLLIQRLECLLKEIRRAVCPNLDAGSLVLNLDVWATPRIELGLPYPHPHHARSRQVTRSLREAPLPRAPACAVGTAHLRAFPFELIESEVLSQFS